MITFVRDITNHARELFPGNSPAEATELYARQLGKEIEYRKNNMPEVKLADDIEWFFTVSAVASSLKEQEEEMKTKNYHCPFCGAMQVGVIPAKEDLSDKQKCFKIDVQCTTCGNIFERACYPSGKINTIKQQEAAV